MIRAIFVALVVAIALLAGSWYFVSTDRSLPPKTVTVAIPRGSSLSEATLRLQRAGVARAVVIRILAKLRGADSNVSAGALIFPAHESAADVLDRLTTKAIPTAIWLTVPEGFTANEIADRLRAKKLTGARGFAHYASVHSLVLGGVRTKTLEGELFPSTYLIPLDATASEIASAMTDQFSRELPPNAKALAHKLGYTIPQIVTVASLIEREAKVDQERPLMAGVYYHRLRIGMPLEVDATLEYAFAHHKTQISEADLSIASPYNSYKRLGLPPTPIANPGRPSLLAALHPIMTPYLFYVYRGGGRHAFARTLEEHNANVERYLH